MSPALYLIRHPRTQLAPDLCHGRLDVPLAEPVAAAAARIRAQLPPDFQHWPLFASPSRRCWQLAAALHPRPQAEARLMEMNFGEWEGQRWPAIGAAALDDWARAPADFIPPGGESARMVEARVLTFLRTLPPVTTVVCVTHGGILRLLAARQQQLPPERWCDLRFDYEAVLRLDVARLGL
ncbi:MAG: histidine phosphatase family protein [Zoogloeaceae bacterium]|jgi:alpha-ribazole phosphatase|nr:histidine phosphatase family protein [Zoogloeaceae bacterium]